MCVCGVVVWPPAVTQGCARAFCQLDDPNLERNQQANIDAAVAVLPRLLVGLEVNVGFSRCVVFCLVGVALAVQQTHTRPSPSVTQFEYLAEMAVFDLLGINLYHGWIVDPDDQPAVRAVPCLPRTFCLAWRWPHLLCVSRTGRGNRPQYVQRPRRNLDRVPCRQG